MMQHRRYALIDSGSIMVEKTQDHSILCYMECVVYNEKGVNENTALQIDEDIMNIISTYETC
jgi:hypothetical protein